jgi:isopenicillin-N N-acyltransferase-like protein
MTTQQPNLIILTITQPGLPTIKMVTEAGIIGKIGLNSHGVGVCFNAIRAPGLSPQNLPAHLGLRMALESTSVLEAVVRLEKEGMASSAHILIGDADTAIGLEFTSTTFARLELNDKGQLAHTNHLLGCHPGINEAAWLKDSPARLVRMDELLAPLQDVDVGEDEFAKLFEDVEGFPGSICRAQEGGSEAATLFNIVMELKKRRAKVTVGRPTDKGEAVILGFEGEK